MPKIILKINSANDKIYATDEVCCYLLNADLPSETIEKCREQDKMLLLFGVDAATKCKVLSADGFVFEPDTTKPLKVQIKKQQEIAGSKKALGVIIPAHRHEAMLAGEMEPDFVAFRVNPQETNSSFDIIKWYNELFLIQSAIDLSSGLLDVSETDVDFVIINSADYEDFGC